MKIGLASLNGSLFDSFKSVVLTFSSAAPKRRLNFYVL